MEEKAKKWLENGRERKRENCIIVSHIKINATSYMFLWCSKGEKDLQSSASPVCGDSYELHEANIWGGSLTYRRPATYTCHRRLRLNQVSRFSTFGPGNPRTYLHAPHVLLERGWGDFPLLHFFFLLLSFTPQFDSISCALAVYWMGFRRRRWSRSRSRSQILALPLTRPAMMATWARNLALWVLPNDAPSLWQCNPALHYW